MLSAYIRTAVSTAGHLSCVCVLFGSNLLIGVIDGTARSIVAVLATLTNARIEQDTRIPHSERVRTFQEKSNSTNETDDLVAYQPDTGTRDGGNSGPNQVLDEAATLAKTVEHATREHPEYAARGDTTSPFLGNQARLKELAVRVICNELGGDDPSLLSEDFQFLFPVVGPLTKDQFLEAFSQFKIRDAFPTSQANFYNFSVDPLEPNRIWFMSRGVYEHLGTLTLGPSKFPATHRRITLPPQCFSMSFDGDGKCYKLTGGYCVDRSAGDTEGLGGVFGIVHGLGLMKFPFPEGRPWKRSLLWEAVTLRIPQVVDDWKRVFAKQ